MPSARKKTRTQATGPCYTAPDVFYELEKDYKQQSKNKQKEGKKKGSNKGKGKKVVDEDDSSEVDQLDSDPDPDDSGHFSPNSSKTRKKKKAVGGDKKQKKIKGPTPFDKLPNEIVTHIFSEVPHEQLYYLLLMSKRFHKLLKSKKKPIKRIWKGARLEVEGLPDMTGMKQKQIAKLLYGTSCQICEKDGGEGDPYLRIVICRDCRKEQLVNTSKVSTDYPEVMHQAIECCIATFVSASGNHTKTRWVFESDLLKESSELFTREKKDSDDCEIDCWKALAGEPGEKGRNKKSMYVPEYSDKVRKEGSGKRVLNYVEKRKEAIKEIEKEGKALWEYLQEKNEVVEQERKEASNARREAIEARVLDIEGYSQDDFCSTFAKSALVTKGSSEIDDKAWEKLKPQILKLIDHCRDLKEKEAEHERLLARIEDVRIKIYDELRGDETYWPLFADFSSFSTIRALLHDDLSSSEITTSQHRNSIDEVVEELEEWKVDTRLNAILLILNRIVDLDEDEELDPDGDAYPSSTGKYDDDWFNLVSSSLCCDIPGCQTTSEEHQIFFGSLPEVLKHQHEQHSGLTSNFKLKDPKPKNRFSLPLEVAAAISDLLEMGELDETTAEGSDVDEMMKGKALQWENAPGVRKGRSKKEKDWKKIISKIKIESDRAHKEGNVLDPTLVLFDLSTDTKPKKKKKGKSGKK